MFYFIIQSTLTALTPPRPPPLSSAVLNEENIMFNTCLLYFVVYIFTVYIKEL